MHADSIPVVRREGDLDGPSVLVTAGVHGDEMAAVDAATMLSEVIPDAGSLTVAPRINQEAIDNNNHQFSDGDLNRHFPPGEATESDLAKDVWEFVSNENPDVLLDLHTSKGILRVDEEGVGQAVFHTPRVFPDLLRYEIQRFNADVMLQNDYSLNYFFKYGYTSGERPLLTHKASWELGAVTYLAEATRRGTQRSGRAEWLYEIGRRILEMHRVIQ